MKFKYGQKVRFKWLEKTLEGTIISGFMSQQSYFWSIMSNGCTYYGIHEIDITPIKEDETQLINICKVSVCECGKDKHNFTTHSDWCPKYAALRI